MSDLVGRAEIWLVTNGFIPRWIVRELIDALKAARAENDRLLAEMQRAVDEGDWA